MTERQLYTVREFCQRNSIGRTKFFELKKANAFRVVRLDGRLMIPAASEQEWHKLLADRALTPGKTPGAAPRPIPT